MENSSIFSYIGFFLAVAIVSLTAIAIAIPMFFRRVVPTNEVHIVQSSKKTISYGKGIDNGGNTYYAWPSWIPIIGVVNSKFTLSVFSINLDNYEAYDQGRLPFMVDIKGFFRISDSETAAERVNSFQELTGQLQSILQGAVRSILAKNELEAILSERSTFGEQFTKEVSAQLKQWGCETVKNIEFMDIRDSRESKVIANIMEKKKSLIEMQSRTEVADNHKRAEIAEITAKQESDLKRQEALQIVGIRTAEKDKAVGIAAEQSQQEIKEQAKLTAEKDMAIKSVQGVKQAEITRDVQIVVAEGDKRKVVITAEGQLENTRRIAEGVLATAQNESEAIKLKGEATAAAEKLMQLASVDPQIALAKEIGSNEGYQNYLVKIKTAEVSQAVGIEQAKALQSAGIKIIANAGDPTTGVNKVMDIFTAKGGLSAATALETFAATDAGSAFLAKFGISLDTAKKELEKIEV